MFFFWNAFGSNFVVNNVDADADANGNGEANGNGDAGGNGDADADIEKWRPDPAGKPLRLKLHSHYTKASPKSRLLQSNSR